MQVSTKKILIVDDHQDNLQLMLNSLFEGGYHNILCATEGQDAIEIASKEMPDLILQDWDMPGISGIDVINKLKSKEKTKNIPVIIATGAMLESTDLDFGLASGAMDYIRKPFDKTELLARIRSTLKYTDLFNAIEQQKNELIIQKEDLAKSQNRLKLLAKASEEALVFLKEDVIIDVSDRFLAFTGFQYEELIGKSLLSMVPAQERSFLLALETEEIAFTGLSLLTVDGGYLPCKARINPFSYNDNGHLILSIQNRKSIQIDERIQQMNAPTERDSSGNNTAEINRFKALVEGQNRQIASITLREYQMNEYLGKLSGKLQMLKDSRDFANNRCCNVLQELIKDISNMQNDRLWDEFKSRFIRVHPDFYRRLLREFPSLSETDLRIMAFIKLNLTTKEISEIIIQPVNTIKAIRKRIRQKLLLTNKTESLLSFLARY